MYTDTESFLRKCANNGLILDSNIFLIYLIGKFAGEKAIESHSRAKNSGYLHGDFDALDWIMKISKKIVTTRYIIAQVSDLYPLEDNEKGKKYKSNEIIDNLCNIIIEDCNSIESLSRRKYTKQFGFADSSILEIAKKDYAILTNDGPLMGYLNEMSACAMNMDRLRAIFTQENHSLQPYL